MAKTSPNPPVAAYNGITAKEAGAFLREKRKQLGLLQADVASRAALPDTNYMTFYETGKHDVRHSKYLPGLIGVLHITGDEVRERLGMSMILDAGTQGDEAVLPPNARPAEAVLLRHLGSVAAGTPRNGIQQVNSKHRLSECPLPSARQYDPDELYILDVHGDSMTTDDVQKTIPEGASILCRVVDNKKRTLQPKRNQIVVAWIPEIGDDGIGVLKKYGKGKDDEVVLESYSPTGPRFPARQYPRMKTQAIVLGFWVEFKQ